MDVLMDLGGSPTYLNNALVVAGNFSDSEIIPVTPIWTSNWLKDELLHYGIEHVDTAYYYNANNFLYRNLKLFTSKTVCKIDFKKSLSFVQIHYRSWLCGV